MTKVMFVCLGNICRSPMAEAILKHKTAERNLDIEVDSCGTADYHIGDSPDPRTLDVLRKNGISFSHRGQQLKSTHFYDYDYLITMDESNRTNALQVAPSDLENKIVKMRDYDILDKGGDVADPWYGDESDFELCYETLDRCIDEFIRLL